MVITLFFGHHHFQSHIIQHCKKLWQDFNLMQAPALYTAIARLSTGFWPLLNGQRGPPTKKFAKP